MAGVTLTERAIQPVVDLDGDVVVYVPGYANKGPEEPTIVTSTNFTTLFGDTPYVFKAASKKEIPNQKYNGVYKGRPEKGWLYAKGLVDAGLTVLFHRVVPASVGQAQLYVSEGGAPESLAVTGGAPFDGATYDIAISKYKLRDPAATKGTEEKEFKDYKLRFRAKYRGIYYTGLSVELHKNTKNGTFTITVRRGGSVLEMQTVSLNPQKANFIGNISFTNIDVVLIDSTVQVRHPLDTTEAALSLVDGVDNITDYSDVNFEEWYTNAKNKEYYLAVDELDATALNIFTGELKNEQSVNLEPDAGTADEFDVEAFMTKNILTAVDALRDTERYQTVTYLTSGGYYFGDDVISVMEALAFDIKSIMLVEKYTGAKLTADTFDAYQAALQGDTNGLTKSAMFAGADTYNVGGYRVILGSAYGYLVKLAGNLAQGIPAWIPVANNPQGVVGAVGTTVDIGYALREMMITSEGISINPIVYKQNTGYTIMGNRTLFPNDGTLAPEGFLNVQLIVNSVLRSARRAAQQLLIVSTSPYEAFTSFRDSVSVTCDKMMVNKDGLVAYEIQQLQSTEPATIDIAINLIVQVGIEQFNVNLSYALNIAG